MRNATLDIAITGGVGCGKSTAAGWFIENGFPVIDADDVCHRALEEPAIRSAVTGRWGKSILGPDGRVDRALVAETVFENPKELEFLNGLLHRRVRGEIAALLAGKFDGDAIPRARFAEIPLLYETGMETLFDAVICVWAPESYSPRIAARAKHQMNINEKLERADYALINYGSPERLFEQCRELARRLQII
ncbi:MAG: dephospho-CoA kinase [Victivallaceae bacterium]|nr:dephospho-CoA kinase [Victivallaceae bacterium]